MPPSARQRASKQPADVTPFDPLAAIEADHAAHFALCDRLEAIADALPASFRPEDCRQALVAFRVDLPRHHADEENGLFPLLKAAADADNLGKALARLEEDHHGDEANGDDLIPVLESMAAGNPPENPDMVGYMLRGFFDAYRRHIAWENSIVLPLARAHLSRAALAELARIMRANRGALGQLADTPAIGSGHTSETARALLRGLCGKADPDLGR